MGSEHVSSHSPINHSKPLEALADEAYHSGGASPGRLDILRFQTDEQESPRPNVITKNVEEPPIDEKANDGLDNADPVNEGHGDNAELSGLRTHPSPIRQSCALIDSVKKPNA
ncbi:hypothetical protein Tco_1424755 [Tanacetum coccineum]